MDEHNDSRKILQCASNEAPREFLERSGSTSMLSETSQNGSDASSDLDVYKKERSDNAKLITALRKKSCEERSSICNRVEAARILADVPELLRLCIEGIVLWTHDVKIDVLTHFENIFHSQPAQSVTRKMPKYLHLLPINMAYLYMLAHDTRNYFEIVCVDTQASAFTNRMKAFDCRRRQFEEKVSNIATRSGKTSNARTEPLFNIARSPSDYKHDTSGLSRNNYTHSIATEHHNGYSRFMKKKSTRARSKPAIAALGDQEENPAERLPELRRLLDTAVRRLDTIPDTELSPTGQPFVKECADAILAFATWFGEQSPDDLPMLGNAHRITYTLAGLSGVIDWVALHWSVEFSNEIEQKTDELVKLAETFDMLVLKAFKSPSKQSEIPLYPNPLPDDVYFDFEQRIGEISGMADVLGRRLQRVAVWASNGHVQTTPNGQQMIPGHPVTSPLSPDTSIPSTPSTKPSSPMVVLDKKGMPCRVLDKEKPFLTDGQYDVVKALLDEGDKGLTKDVLESIRPSARNILKNLRKDPDWAMVILMAGQTNGRYRIKS